MLCIALLWPLISGPLNAAAQTEGISLHISGNRHFPTRKIERILQEQIGGSRADSVQLRKRVSGAVEHLLSVYRGEGYLHARVDSLRWQFGKNASPAVRIYLQEGPQFQVGKILIVGNSVLTDRDIRNSLNVYSGKPFRARQLQDGIAAVLREYARRGYLLARVDITKLELNDDRQTVDLLLNIRENRPVVLRKWQIQGLQHTRRQTVQRELGFGPGDYLTSERIRKIPDRLRRLQVVRLAGKPKLQFTPDSGAVIILPLKEVRTSHLDGVLGYNPPAGRQKGYMTGMIDLQFGNLFGTGRTFSAYWNKRTPLTEEIRLNYREPWILGFPLNGEIGFQQVVQDTFYVRRSWHIGGRVFLFENLSLRFQVGQENVIPDSAGIVRYALPRSQANRLFLALDMDSRDYPWNPTRGLFYRTSVEMLRKQVSPLPGSSGRTRIDFRRIRLDMEIILPLLRRQPVLFALHGRQVEMGDRIVPIDDLFRVGGSKGLRGYRDEQFWGSHLLWGTLEYRFLLDRDSRISLFVDAGYIGKRNDTGRWEVLTRVGYGLGIQTRTDLGLIGFDYGLGQGDSFMQGKVHVRLTNTF